MGHIAPSTLLRERVVQPLQGLSGFRVITLFGVRWSEFDSPRFHRVLKSAADLRWLNSDLRWRDADMVVRGVRSGEGGEGPQLGPQQQALIEEPTRLVIGRMWTSFMPRAVEKP